MKPGTRGPARARPGAWSRIAVGLAALAVGAAGVAPPAPAQTGIPNLEAVSGFYEYRAMVERQLGQALVILEEVLLLR